MRRLLALGRFLAEQLTTPSKPTPGCCAARITYIATPERAQSSKEAS